MIAKHTTMTATPNALIIRIPWAEVTSGLWPKLKKQGIILTADQVLQIVQEGRQAHAKGKTRAVKSLAEIR